MACLNALQIWLRKKYSFQKRFHEKNFIAILKPPKRFFGIFIVYIPAIIMTRKFLSETIYAALKLFSSNLTRSVFDLIVSSEAKEQKPI